MRVGGVRRGEAWEPAHDLPCRAWNGASHRLAKEPGPNKPWCAASFPSPDASAGRPPLAVGWSSLQRGKREAQVKWCLWQSVLREKQVLLLAFARPFSILILISLEIKQNF